MNEKSEKLYKFLLEVKEGVTVTYDEIRQILGFDIREKRYAWTNVTKKLFKTHGILFHSESGIGYTKSNNNNKVDTSRKCLARAHKSAIKSLEVSTTVNIKKVDPENRARHYTNVFIASSLLQFTNPGNIMQKDDEKRSSTPHMSKQDILDLVQAMK